MRTFSRGILFAILFTAGLTLLRSQATDDLIRYVVKDNSWLVWVRLGIAALLSIVIGKIVFILIHASIDLGGSLLYYTFLLVTGMIGFFIVKSINWILLITQLPNLSLDNQWALIVTFSFYLLASLIAQPLPPNVPAVHLNTSEIVECWVQQTRIKHLITPDSLIATNLRLIILRPTGIGINYDVESRQYVNFIDVTLKNGPFFSTLTITEIVRGNNPIVITDIPKYKAKRLFQTITHHINPNNRQPDRNVIQNNEPIYETTPIRPKIPDHYEIQEKRIRSKKSLSLLWSLVRVSLLIMLLLIAGLFFIDPALLDKLPWSVRPLHDWLFQVWRLIVNRFQA